MEPSVLREVLAAHRPREIPFPYYRDRYAVDLLARYVGPGRPLREVRSSPYAPLLEKPAVARVLARLGNARLDAASLAGAAPARAETYRLTLGRWGSVRGYDRSWHQTSRPGKNLVIQVNFPAAHDRGYRKFLGDTLLRDADEHPFEYSSHPIHGGDLRTLAWARIDADPRRGEALIEEIQTDWVREADSYYRSAEDELEATDHRDPGREAERIRLYFERMLAPHRRIWDELTLHAAITFVRDRLGIRRIFHHSFESGNHWKGLSPRFGPPRSLYTRLPKRFCFRPTAELPRFLRPPRAKTKLLRDAGPPPMFLLELE